MTKKERRIAILKDVLAQLKAEKFKAMTGSYFKLPTELIIKSWDGEEYDAKIELLACKKACSVCAKGSIFLSTIRKENQVKLHELDWNMEDEDNKGTKKVVNLFGGSNLNKIEAAFEKYFYIVEKKKEDKFKYYSQFRTDGYYDNNGIYRIEYRKKDEKIVNFVKKHPGKKDRLVAIIKNCIRNNGIFHP